MIKIKKTTMIKAELWSKGKLLSSLHRTGFTSIRQIQSSLRLLDPDRTEHQLLYKIWDLDNNFFKEF